MATESFDERMRKLMADSASQDAQAKEAEKQRRFAEHERPEAAIAAQNRRDGEARRCVQAVIAPT